MNDEEENPRPTLTHTSRMRHVASMTVPRKFHGDYRIFRNDLRPCVKTCLQIPCYASRVGLRRDRNYSYSRTNGFRIHIIAQKIGCNVRSPIAESIPGRFADQSILRQADLTVATVLFLTVEITYTTQGQPIIKEIR